MPFYNTSSPTPQTKNTINSVSVIHRIRDFLLNKNLLPAYPHLGTTINGSQKIGEPVLDTMIGNGAIHIPIGLPLETNGLIWKDLNIIKNTFQNDSANADFLTEIDDINKIPNSNFNGSDWPNGMQSYPTSATDDVDIYGIKGKTNNAGFRNTNTLKNLYVDISKQIDVSAFINLNPINTTQQLTSYTDAYGNLNLGNHNSEQTLNIIGSIANGQGLGLAKGGVVTNYDVRASLAGRVLGATGFLNDTKLGVIGGQQLALSLANNAAFNIQQEALGALNVQDNIISLIKGNGFSGFRPSYKITIPSSTGGKIGETASRLLGFTIPRSFLSDDGSIFQTESKQISNVDRANNMLLNTGKGQIETLLSNVRANQLGISPFGVDSPSNSLFRVGYAPAYTNNKGEVQITDGTIYAFGQEGKNFDLFSSEDKAIADLSYLRDGKVSNSGFKSPEETFTGPIGNAGYNNRKISDVGFTWTTGKGSMVNTTSAFDELIDDGTNKKSLLVKTQKLFNSKGMKTIVTGKGDMNKNSTQISQANGGGFSKGNAVLSSNLFDKNSGRLMKTADNPDETYCRSWTTLDRYDTVSKLVRSGIDNISSFTDNPSEYDGTGINTNVPYRFETQGSILDGYGNPRIAPYTTDKAEDPKKFMFSIENLAWHDDFQNLPQSEQGPGDLLTEKRGRIMWFPPYNINFSENSSVNWETSNFIGRGEPIYTYNNTERTGNLSFQVIVDHPSYVNAFRGSQGPDDNYVSSFWAGCIDPDSEWGKKLTVVEKSDIVRGNPVMIPQQKQIPKAPPTVVLNVYFPNDNSNINLLYENGKSGTTSGATINYRENEFGTGYGLVGGSVADTTQKAIAGKTLRWTDRYNLGLNYSENSLFSKFVTIGDTTLKGYFDPQRVQVMGTYLTTICKFCKIKVTGHATIQGFNNSNVTLANKRRDNVLTELKKEITPFYEAIGLKPDQIAKRFSPQEGKEQPQRVGCPRQTKEVPDPATDAPQCKIDRFVSLSIEFDADLAQEEVAQPADFSETTVKRITTTITDRFYNETKYFDQLTDADKFVFDSFREKIKYFHPAFHSTTPEGLNSRLTFLLQCTRQGRTMDSQGANNLAFGRPPICILRIGDFYHTKIVIDSVGITYDPLVWDLNPEGIGVQPMIANVDISFKFIGGSSLMGPINKLQNALSFNYFANSRVYDPRADYIVKSKPINPDADKSKEPAPPGLGDNSILLDNVTVYSEPWKPYRLGKVENVSSNDISTSEELLSYILEDPNQSLENDIALGNFQGEEPELIEPFTAGTLTGLRFVTGQDIVKDSTGWDIPIIITFDGNVADLDTTAENVFPQGVYKLRVKDVNSKEIFEDLMVSVAELKMFMHPFEGSILRVPNTNDPSYLVRGGLKDSIGKEKYYISLVKDDKEEFKLNLLLP